MRMTSYFADKLSIILLSFNERGPLVDEMARYEACKRGEKSMLWRSWSSGFR
jgi:hypothetical protein